MVRLASGREQAVRWRKAATAPIRSDARKAANTSGICPMSLLAISSLG
jgi:hypothetical protein